LSKDGEIGSEDLQREGSVALGGLRLSFDSIGSLLVTDLFFDARPANIGKQIRRMFEQRGCCVGGVEIVRVWIRVDTRSVTQVEDLSIKVDGARRFGRSTRCKTKVNKYFAVAPHRK
jgi:hypothetical protein